jgi:hypothetical protein
MATDVFVNQLQRVGTTTGGLAAPEAALVFDSSTFTVTDDPTTVTSGEGSITGRTVVSLVGGAAILGYVSATRSGAGISAIWYNDTASARVVGVLRLVPLDNITASGSNYWTISMALGSAPTTPIVSLSSSASGFSAGTALSFSGSVTVPVGDTLVVRQVSTGSPASLGIFVQGR